MKWLKNQNDEGGYSLLWEILSVLYEEAMKPKGRTDDIQVKKWARPGRDDSWKQEKVKCH